MTEKLRSNRSNDTTINDTTIKKHYPVVIVGGGMVGSSLALALAQQGIECAVFEAFAANDQAQPSFDDRTVALSAASLNILRSLGVAQDFEKVAEPIKHIHVSEQGHIGFARLSAEKQNVEKLGAVIENWQLGHVLKKHIAQNTNIDYCAPATVKELKQTPESAELLVELNQGSDEGSDEDKSQKSYPVSAQLVVLADGAHSPLRQQLHIDSEQHDFGMSAMVCNISTQLPHNNWAFERFTQDGPVALLPLTQKRMALVWSKPRQQVDDYLAMTEQQFAKELEATFGARLGKITKVGQRKSFPLIQQKAETLFRGRCVLVGNAAQSLHPIAGQGFNLGLRDIAVLSQTLVSQRSAIAKKSDDSDDDSDYGAYELLNRYQELRLRDRAQTIWVTESLARLFTHTWTPLAISRNLVLKAMDVLPGAKTIFAQQAMGFNFNNSKLASNE